MTLPIIVTLMCISNMLLALAYYYQTKARQQ